MNNPETPKLSSRRDFLRKASYTAPGLLTLPAAPSFAQSGSGGGGSGGGPTCGTSQQITQYIIDNNLQSLSPADQAEILQAAFPGGVCDS